MKYNFNFLNFLAISILLILSNSIICQEVWECVHVQEGGGGEVITSIPPSASDIYALSVYVSFPDDVPNNNLPSYYSDIENSIFDFFDEMSYGNHHVHLTTPIRPSPDQTKCYIANNNSSYYQSSYNITGYGTTGHASLTTEILWKLYNDDPTIFTGIDYIGPQKLDQRLRWKTKSPMESYESKKVHFGI